MWEVLEVALIIIISVFVITQMIIPPFIRKPLFWVFRKVERVKEEKVVELSDIRTEGETSDIEEEIEKTREKIKPKRTRKKPTRTKMEEL